MFIYTDCDPSPCPNVARIKVSQQPHKSTEDQSHRSKHSGKGETLHHYTYLMNKSHHQALDISDTATLPFWQTSASLSILLSLLLLFFFFFLTPLFLHSPSLHIQSYFLHSLLYLAARRCPLYLSHVRDTFR